MKNFRIKQIDHEIHYLYFSCDYIFHETTKVENLSEENIQHIKPCKKIMESEHLIKKLIDNRDLTTSFSLIYSLGIRLMHNIEIYEFSKKYFYMPTLYNYKDVIKINGAEKRISQSTPHNSFALIQIKLGIFGLILISFFIK